MANVADSSEHYFEPPERRRLAFVLAVVFLIANLFVIETAYRFAVWANLFRSSPWNWFGKAISIVFTCSVLACSPWLQQNIGLRWRQAPGSLSLSIGCLATFLACAIGIGFLMPPMMFSTDTLIFQFFIPAIDEELIFRGIVLALLERAFGQSPMGCRLRFGYAALIMSIVFGLGHAISIEDGRLHFASLVFSFTAVWAAVVTLVRTRSGSLLGPVILHSVWDGVIFLVPMLR